MWLARVRQRSAGEQGFALITVMLALMVLTGLTVAIVGYGIGSQNISHRDQNWNAAFSAAKAGVNDCLNRINNTPGHATSCGTDLGVSENKAMTATTSTGADWAEVPGTSNAKFRYWVDSDANAETLARSGFVSVVVTGKVGNAARTVEAELRVPTLLDYVYSSDFELLDPRFQSNASSCSAPHYAYDQPGNSGYDSNATDPNDTNRCRLLYFSTGDVINGPFHTNDWMRVCGNPEFNGPASTSYPGYEPTASSAVKPGDVLWRPPPSCSNAPQFVANPDTTNLVYAQLAPQLLSSIDGLKANAGVGTGGCYYRGPTTIKFDANGTMDVWSPNSSLADVGAGCPLGTSSPTNGALPSNGVVYVDRINGGCNPNRGNGVGYPKDSDPSDIDLTTYSCSAGDVFVQGSLNGQVTVGAFDNVIVTGDLLYHDKTKGSTSYQGTDLLGLMANGDVAVYHPVVKVGGNNGNKQCEDGDETNNPSYKNQSTAITDPEIDAAILSVFHSFYAQNWECGDTLGEITVFGAIAQKYAGKLGTADTSGVLIHGYNKAFNYDNRLKYLEPPYFLNLTTSVFQQVTFKELTPRLS